MNKEELDRIRKESDEYCAPCTKDDDCTDQCKLIQEIDRLNKELSSKTNYETRCEKCGQHLENSEFKPVASRTEGNNCSGCGCDTLNCECDPVSEAEAGLLYQQHLARWESSPSRKGK